MHHSRLCALLIDCKAPDVDEAAQFWSRALGRAVDPDHPGTRGNYVMLETPPDEPIVQIQRVDHESRVHIDIETDDIPAEVARLEKLGATIAVRLERWVVMRRRPANASASCACSVPISRRTPIAGTTAYRRSHGSTAPWTMPNRGCGSGDASLRHRAYRFGLRIRSLRRRCVHSYSSCPRVALNTTPFGAGPIFRRSNVYPRCSASFATARR